MSKRNPESIYLIVPPPSPPLVEPSGAPHFKLMAVRRKWVHRDGRAAMPVGAPRQVRRKWVRRILNLSV